ncbi:hypothetical protein E2C01_054212 [Portunus trituberculatus]|uniref:Reverse transcriptase zinc-binding domain-containing protein n=1 Tax=Portunus trituberculatus TaxID=210409 RepID=A0A5B7GUE5_PORTR|nr:hypothetical protein [Portunus trituberculatus]
MEVSVSLHTSTQWSKASCPVEGRTLFTSLLHSQYQNHFYIHTNGSRLTNPPSIGAAIYFLSRSLATAWRLPATWVFSHVTVMGNMVANNVAPEAHTHSFPIDLATHQTRYPNRPQDSLQATLGHIRQDTRHPWWTYSPNWVQDTAVTRLQIGHTRLNAHLHRLGMTDSPHCPWFPTEPDTQEHLLLHCPRHHSHHVALLHSLSAHQPHRPTMTDL